MDYNTLVSMMSDIPSMATDGMYILKSLFIFTWVRTAPIIRIVIPKDPIRVYSTSGNCNSATKDILSIPTRSRTQAVSYTHLRAHET